MCAQGPLKRTIIPDDILGLNWRRNASGLGKNQANWKVCGTKEMRGTSQRQFFYATYSDVHAEFTSGTYQACKQGSLSSLSSYSRVHRVSGSDSFRIPRLGETASLRFGLYTGKGQRLPPNGCPVLDIMV